MYERDGQTHTDRRTLHDDIGRALPIQSIARQKLNAGRNSIAHLNQSYTRTFLLASTVREYVFLCSFFKIQKRVFTFS